jgi:hypothetical protein
MGTAVGTEKILVTVLYGAHKRQVEEVMETLSEGPAGFHGARFSFCRNPFPYRGGTFHVPEGCVEAFLRACSPSEPERRGHKRQLCGLKDL